MRCRHPYHDERSRGQEGGGVVFRKHSQACNESEGMIVEKRRGQGRESSEAHSESEDCGYLVGSRGRDLSGVAVAVKVCLLYTSDAADE